MSEDGSGSIPSPNFGDADASSGFLAFSSTPIHGNNFTPKWGKKNRIDNWKRFGNSVSENTEDSRSPGFTSNQNSSFGGYPARGQFRGGGGPGGPQQRGGPPQSPNFRGNFSPHRGRGGDGNYSPYGGRGGGNFTPRGNGEEGGYTPRGNGRGNFTPRGDNGGGGWRGGNGQFTPRGGRGRGGFDNSRSQDQNSGGKGNIAAFFHPTMLQDPWRELEVKLGNKSYRSNQFNTTSNSRISEDVESSKPDFSDSMIPQVGDSLVQRNNDLEDVFDESS